MTSSLWCNWFQRVERRIIWFLTLLSLKVSRPFSLALCVSSSRVRLLLRLPSDAGRENRKSRSPHGECNGFVEGDIRHDYVNECSSFPVAFLEGIYVSLCSRQQGIARRLTDEIALWAQKNGCSEFASDADLSNTNSHAMHRALGFDETERVVFFRKRLT
ncbi:MAG: GNAT family N-acetyltransferase [Zymomonas mobilis]|uniref:GNAT family N-acetyltransferase n=1 Tax=Zymomonas mobilis TaxID=542 RepID=UPI0039E7FF4A